MTSLPELPDLSAEEREYLSGADYPTVAIAYFRRLDAMLTRAEARIAALEAERDGAIARLKVCADPSKDLSAGCPSFDRGVQHGRSLALKEMA